MKTALQVFALLLALAADAEAQPLAAEHRVALEEAFRLMEHVEPRWPGWDAAPEAVLLVDGDFEFLIGHPNPSDDFRSTGEPSLFGHTVLVRERLSPVGLLATYPAVGGVPTIVVGTPASTGLNPTRWILTLVHEHFHQLQMSLPTYYSEVAALGLSDPDDGGMWMLNYPFPYADAAASGAVGRLGRVTGASAATVRGSPGAPVSTSDFLSARRELTSVLDEKDDRYLAFQVWQEGIARYAELDAAERAVESFELSRAFTALPGSESLEAAAEALWTSIAAGADADPSELGRVYFYSLGALEAVLLEASRPEWRQHYTQSLFDTRALWDPSR